MVIRRLILLFFLPLSTCVAGQDTAGWVLSGVVVDTFGNAVGGSLIIIRDSTGEDFFFAGREGRFERKVSQPQITIEVKKLSFQSYTQSINRRYHPPLTVRLTPSGSLKEVVVVRERLPIEKRQDTLRYNLPDFVDSTERVVEDILKKLPGITVSESGVISVGGKPISKLLIEEDDLFGRQYTIGTKNIRADAIESVEVFRHYQENAVLSSVKESDNVAINLKLKKAKNIASAGMNMAAGAGARPVARLSANVFWVNKILKSIFLTDDGTTGNEFGPEEIDATYDVPDSWLQSSPLASSGFLVTPLSIASFGYPREYLDNRASIFGTLRNVVKLGKRWKLKPKIVLTRKNNYQTGQNYFAYRRDTSLFRLSSSFETEYVQKINKAGVEISYLHPKNKASLFCQIEIGRNLLDGKMAKKQINIPLLTSARLGKNEIFSSALFSKVIHNQKVIQVGAKLVYNEMPQYLSLYNVDYQSLGWISDSSLTQNLNKKGRYFEVFSKWISKKKKGFFELSPRIEVRQLTLISQLQEAVPDSVRNGVSTLSSYFPSFFLAGTNSFRSLGKLHWQAGSRYLWTKRTENGQRKSPYFSASASFEKNWGSHSLRAGLYFAESPYLFDHFYGNIFFRSVSSYVVPVRLMGVTRKQGISAGYRYEDLFNLLSLDWRMRIGWQKLPVVEKLNFHSAIISGTDTLTGESVNRWMRISIKKFFRKVKTDAELSYSISSGSFPSIAGNVTFREKLVSQNYRLSCSVSLFDRLRLKSQSALMLSKFGGKGIGKMTSWRQEFLALYRLSRRFETGLRAFSLANYLEGFQSFQNRPFVSFFIKLHPKRGSSHPNETIRLDIHNLLGIKRIDSGYRDNYFINTSSIDAGGRYFLISYDIGF